MKIDSTTWCAPENQAGQYLAKHLEEIGDNKLPEKVSTYFHRFQNRMNALNGMEKGMRVFYLDLLMKKTKAEIDSNIQYKKVKTLMMNIITSFYRLEMVKIHPNKNQKS